MKITLENIEKEVIKATKNACVGFDVTYDCGNAYVNVKGSNNAITTVVFDESGNFSTIYTTQYKAEFTDDNGEPTGDFFDVDNTLYEGNSLTTALNKLRLAS
jgi:hypothetical protein